MNKVSSDQPLSVGIVRKKVEDRYRKDPGSDFLHDRFFHDLSVSSFPFFCSLYDFLHPESGFQENKGKLKKN